MITIQKKIRTDTMSSLENSTHYSYNDDGTVSLIVDAVWADKGSDIAFRNTLTVKPEEDGTFKYMSNHIEKMECDIPVYSD